MALCHNVVLNVLLTTSALSEYELYLLPPNGGFRSWCTTYSSNYMNIISDTNGSIDGGAVADDAIGTALLASGAILGCGWSLGSTVHTLVSAPLLSLGALGGSTALAAGGAYRITRNGKTFKEFFKSDALNVEATAVA